MKLNRIMEKCVETSVNLGRWIKLKIHIENWRTSCRGISGDQSRKIRRTRIISHVAERSTTVAEIGLVRVKRWRNWEWETVALDPVGTDRKIGPEIGEKVILVIYECCVWCSVWLIPRWDSLWASVFSFVCQIEDRRIIVRSLDLFRGPTILCVTKCTSVITPATQKQQSIWLISLHDADECITWMMS